MDDFKTDITVVCNWCTISKRTSLMASLLRRVVRHPGPSATGPLLSQQQFRFSSAATAAPKLLSRTLEDNDVNQTPFPPAAAAAVPLPPLLAHLPHAAENIEYVRRVTEQFLPQVQKARLARLREMLIKHNCAAGLFHDPCHVRYATDASNMTIWHKRNQIRYLMVPANDCDPVTLWESMFVDRAGMEKLMVGFFIRAIVDRAGMENVMLNGLIPCQDVHNFVRKPPGPHHRQMGSEHPCENLLHGHTIDKWVPNIPVKISQDHTIDKWVPNIPVNVCSVGNLPSRATPSTNGFPTSR